MGFRLREAWKILTSAFESARVYGIVHINGTSEKFMHYGAAHLEAATFVQWPNLGEVTHKP